MNIKKSISILSCICLFITTINAQETKVKEDIDPSNPTNLYTQINGILEYQDTKAADLFGLRTNVQYAFNTDNLVLAEFPVLHNNVSDKTGLSDIRVRYYHVAKKGITKKFIAILPFFDVTLPTGSYENGLGTSSWSLGAGLIFGYVVNPKLSFFPGLNYVHLTKPTTDLLPENAKFASNGVGLQFNASYKFTKNTFLFFNPTPNFINTNSKWSTSWGGDLTFNHIFIPNKFKMNTGWSPNFTAKINIFKIGATIFI